MKDENSPRRSSGTVRVEDVARVAGVSPITVSRALSTPQKVKEETRQKVTDAVVKTGYVVNGLASMLRSGRSAIVSLFVSNLQDQHLANLIQGCADAFEGTRYRLMMAPAGHAGLGQQDLLEQVLPYRPAAVMFTGTVKSERVRAQLRGLAIPVMETWDYRPDPVDMLVGLAHAEGGRLMGAHFAQLGFRRIAYAGGVSEAGLQRLDGFREGLAAHGGALACVLPVGGRPSIGEGMAALGRARRELPGCDAIFFGSDVLAVGAMLRARQLGVDVPGELALAGYGDLEFSSQLHVPLTTVHVSSYQIGFTAGQMLRRRLDQDSVPERVVLSPLRLVPRASTGRAADGGSSRAG